MVAGSREYHNWKWPLMVSFLFVIIYGLIVFVNHHCFRTYALDLGAYTNALYDYAHFQWNDSTVFKQEPQNLLADHLDFYLFIFAPLSYVFGQYTLLLVQIISVISGGTGCYNYLRTKFGDSRLSVLGMLHFYLFFGTFSALSFDYHSNVVAAMQLPWLFYFVEKRKPGRFIVVMCLVMIAKETMPLWCFFISVGLLIQYRKEKQLRPYFVFAMLFSMAYFLLCIEVLMPMLANSGKYEHFKYAILGKDYGSALKFVIMHPLDTLKYLFLNHSGNHLYDWVKTESYIFLLLSGLYCLFARPYYLVMLLGPLCSKMLYNDPAIWSIDTHYSVEFAAILTIGAFSFAGSLSHARARNCLPLILCIGSLAATIRLMDHTIYFHDYNRLRIYQSGHYHRGYDIDRIYKALEAIPEDAVVSAQSPILPHLAWRDHCYQLPIIKDAGYIIVSRSEPVTYPLAQDKLWEQLNDSMASGRWAPIVNDSNVTLLKRLKE
jgi:uncharacterized membrane protein